ncbi:hypothetical protein KW787_03130 [Candidatus Pacearchaeota archaeon]|nr:hypothetical protein [Candidatus Pacearchaeota archaeon]
MSKTIYSIYAEGTDPETRDINALPKVIRCHQENGGLDALVIISPLLPLLPLGGWYDVTRSQSEYHHIPIWRVKNPEELVKEVYRYPTGTKFASIAEEKSMMDEIKILCPEYEIQYKECPLLKKN